MTPFVYIVRFITRVTVSLQRSREMSIYQFICILLIPFLFRAHEHMTTTALPKQSTRNTNRDLRIQFGYPNEPNNRFARALVIANDSSVTPSTSVIEPVTRATGMCVRQLFIVYFIALKSAYLLYAAHRLLRPDQPPVGG